MISEQLLREVYLQCQQGYDGHRNFGQCDVCGFEGPNRRVGKKYWLCGHCTQKFALWKRHELAAGATLTFVEVARTHDLAAHTEAAATLLQLSQQTPK